ncbi:O-antigen ligase family protein [Streptomyces mirabilis]|uniref:O-antigen ligase family protein n=1 Tax=Streptomyces mirabilis TaxID=68239 RepID=UPI00332E9130
MGTLLGVDSALLGLLFSAACVGALLLVSVFRRVAVWLLWGAALAPLFLFGRDYATVGLDPVYLLDVLVVLALLAGSPVWASRALSESRLRGYRMCAILLAVAAAQAVVRGVSQGYPGAMKGCILGLYPLFAWAAAAWFLTQPVEEFLRRRWLLYLPTTGALLMVVLGRSVTPAAVGLYLAIAAAFGMVLRKRGDSRLLLWTLIGSACLTAAADKRGPLLAVGAALAATTLASRACRRRTVQWPALTWSFLIMGLVAVISVSVVYRQPSDLPVVGGLVNRMQASENDADSEAANNVELRYVMWRTALDVARSEPLLGAGAGRPIEVVFQGAELDKAASGPHNSFVGYIYYLGWLAGTAFALLIVATLWRTWRARSHPVASAWFGATVGVCCIAFTNVAFETTYIGLPSWLVVACAFALVGVPRTAVPAGDTGSAPLTRQSSPDIALAPALSGTGPSVATARRSWRPRPVLAPAADPPLPRPEVCPLGR